MAPIAADHLIETLNFEQRQAVEHGDGPLLIVAGAGTGKTATLVHRVAWLILRGSPSQRILLLTFTRRAAAEMIRRAESLIASLDGLSATGNRPSTRVGRIWGGTFHAIATRLLRRYGEAIGLSHNFMIHDRTDSEDLMGVLRTELGLHKADQRFPQKATCLDIYSRCVNAQEELTSALTKYFPWCLPWKENLRKLFDAYVDRKRKSAVLDYDDLLVCWIELLDHPRAGSAIRRLFDYVLVDEYQDTNPLQAQILYRLCPEGKGLTCVGDDAQSIYSFRGATVYNMLEFPKRFPNATVVTLEQNYRSTQPVLNASNAVLREAREGYRKTLWSERKEGPKPILAPCMDEDEQTEFVIERILDFYNRGIALRRQAVLFRASFHSIGLEAELLRRRIPFHKYGGLKFAETAHVKDLLAFLRVAENPRDLIAGTRILVMLPGIGPRTAQKLLNILAQAGGNFSAWRDHRVASAAAQSWKELVDLMVWLAAREANPAEQLAKVRAFYAPFLPQLYDNPIARSRDLEQVERIASRYRSRKAFLTEMALDPPNSTQDLSGNPELEEDYLVLSTIHSAKGLEWDAVYVIHATDGNIPSDMVTDCEELIEEERRLFYVALTRARTHLFVCYPMRYFRPGFSTGSFGADFGLAQISRFLTPKVCKAFEELVPQMPRHQIEDFEHDLPDGEPDHFTNRRYLRRLWS